MSGYLRLELSRTARDLRYLTLAVIAPVGFYLPFSAVFGGRSAGPNTTFGLPAAKEIMVAMATFGTMWAALSATAPRLARDREGGWLAYLATTPASPTGVLVARILAALAVALPAIVAVALAALIAHGVRLEAWRWASALALLWIGTLPFAILGIAIGSLAGATVAYALSTAAWFALAALGGLWVPPGQLSPGLRHVAEVLPSYNQAARGWHVISGSAPSAGNVLALVGWTAGLAALALFAGRRRRNRSARVAPTERDGNPAIDLRGLVKRFGAVTALDGLDLRVPAGETVALLGPNGSGKTTTIASLLGLLAPEEGWLRLFGSSPTAATRAGRTGVMLQDAELMAGVRVAELIGVIHGLYPDPTEKGLLMDLPGVRELLGRRTDQLSGGQAQRVRFVLALAGNPSLLVLDEPTAAMDVQARRDLWAALHRHTAQHDTTVLFSTHYLEEADEHAGRVVLIRSGRVVADGTPAQVKASAGPGRMVRFTLLRGRPEPFRQAPGVVGLDVTGDRVTLHTRDADATVWGLYAHRNAIADLQIADASLEDAFLSLTVEDHSLDPVHP